MGNEYVDPGWGALGTSFIKAFQDAPKRALDQTMTVEQIIALREEQARKKAIFDANVQSGKSVGDTLATFGPPKSVRDVMVQPEGPINPDDPATFLPPVQRKEEYVDPIVEARYKAELPMYQKIAGAVAQGQGGGDLLSTYGRATAGLQGVPTDRAERERLNVLLTGKLLTSDESKLQNSQNYTIFDRNNQAIGNYATRDGRTTNEGRPIRELVDPSKGQYSLETGSAPRTTNPLENEASARERLNVLSREIGPNGPTQDQAVQISQLVDVGYRPKRVVEKVGDQNVVKYVQENPIPSWVTAMMGAPPAAPAAASAAPAPLPPVPYLPTDPTVPTSASTAPAPVPAAPAAPAAAPFDPNADRIVERLPGSAIELRKEYASLPEIKNHANAATTWNAAVQSAYTGNKAADLAIVYGFIKMLDNITGVRDAEVKMVGQVGSWAEQVNTMLGQAKGTGLDPRTRVNIIETMQRHMHEIQNAAQEKEKFYAQTARETGLAPNSVLAPLAQMVEFDRAKALAVKNETSRRGRDANATATTPAPAPTSAPPTPDQIEALDKKLGLTGNQ